MNEMNNIVEEISKETKVGPAEVVMITFSIVGGIAIGSFIAKGISKGITALKNRRNDNEELLEDFEDSLDD